MQRESSPSLSAVGYSCLASPLPVSPARRLSEQNPFTKSGSSQRGIWNIQPSPSVPKVPDDSPAFDTPECETDCESFNEVSQQELTKWKRREASKKADCMEDFQKNLTEELVEAFEDLHLYMEPYCESDMKKLKERTVAFSGLSEHKKTLLLDLDETLVHSVPSSLFEENSVENLQCLKLRLPEYVEIFKDKVRDVVAILRPGVVEFLEAMSFYYDIIIYTASKRAYAEKVVQALDPNGNIITGLLSRAQCLKRHQFPEKDPRILKDANLKNIVIVDNQIQSFGLHMANGVYVKSFFADGNDRELERLALYLQRLSEEQDVREIISKTSGLKKLYMKFLESH